MKEIEVVLFACTSLGNVKMMFSVKQPPFWTAKIGDFINVLRQKSNCYLHISYILAL